MPTPGQNKKHFVAGTLHAHPGRLIWVQHWRKNASLFLKLLDAVHRSYRGAKRIEFILDNYIIHKSEWVRRWLTDHPKFKLVFQPTYSPWVNENRESLENHA